MSMHYFLQKVFHKIKRVPVVAIKHIRWFLTIRYIYNKNGIEFGGPTELFYHPMHRMMLYPYVKSLDGGNIFEDNFFQNSLSSTFTYYKNRSGIQYSLDIADEKSISLLPSTYDFILSSHNIEHIANPISALILWKRILKQGGYVLAVMPHKEYTFDRKRPYTTLEHLIDDYKKNTQEDDMTHREEQVLLHDWTMGGMKDFEELSLQNGKTRVIHHHCFDTELVRNMFEYAGYTTLKSYYIGDGNIVYLGKVISS